MAQIQAITRAQQAPQQQFGQQPQPQQQTVQPSTPDIGSILAALGGATAGQQQAQQQANNNFLQNLIQQNPTTQAQNAALGSALASFGLPLFQPLASFGQAQPPPASTGYEAPVAPKAWSTYDSQPQQAYGSDSNNGNNANQSAWTGSGGTDEFGRALRDGEKEKEGRSGRDIRRDLRKATGWDERKVEAEQPLSGSGNGGSGSGRGGGWGGKHKKVNY